MAMEARRTGGAESGQDRTESSKKWSGGQGGDEDDGNESGRPTQMKKIRKLGGGERERSQSCGIRVGRRESGRHMNLECGGEEEYCAPTNDCDAEEETEGSGE
ncbi:unnamed protein product [Miscanthus lutarioriparius]|uniref:Uncharacterized protein n=1 Tax=Miscanthus lutarioriparius TaxID=422564 RepID=A0A811RJT2_9POAL|nr:unnamed protein product [Miscanthus lutarioriparius]